MTRKRFFKLRYALCVQIREGAKKQGVKPESKNRLAYMGIPKMVLEGEKTYQECWDFFREYLPEYPVCKVEK